MKWEELPLADRAQLMAAAVRNGYTDIRSIKAAYANFQNQRQQTGNRYDDGGELEVVNPLDNVPVDDQEERYQYFRSTLPENLQDDTVYRLRRAWELNGEPRAFSDAIVGDNPMFSYNIDDELYHGNSVAYNPNTDEYEFLKPVDHDTVDLELMQYFNNPELEQLRQNYQMDWDEDGSRGYYKYIPRTDDNALAYGGNLFKTGGNKGKKKGITQQELQRRKDYYRQQLIIRGLRGAQLEAVLANMEVESTFDPGAHNDASGARGLMQWLGSRKPKSWSEKDQLDYIAATYNRFGGNEWLDKKAWKRFNETTDPAEAARLFRRYWERPERSSWNATDALFKNSKGSYLPQDVNDLVAQVSNLQYDEPKAPIFTEEDQRLLDTPALAFYNPEYEDTQAPDHKPSALQKSIKLDESLWRDPANNWALYNQFANMQQGSSQDDPLSWMTTMASLSPNTTPEQKEAASTMYQLFAPQDGDYSYHGLNFAAYGGKVNRLEKGGLKDEFANKYLGIGQFPNYDADFIAVNNLQYLPYSQINLNGADPENTRIVNQGGATMRAWDDDNATYLADANGNLVTGSMLKDMTQRYIENHYGDLLDKAFLANPDKYWNEKRDWNLLHGGIPLEKPIEPKAPEFYLLAGGAHALQGAIGGLSSTLINPMVNYELTDGFISNTTPYSGWGNLMSENVGGPEWAWDLTHPSFTGGLVANAAKKALTVGADATRKSLINATARTAFMFPQRNAAQRTSQIFRQNDWANFIQTVNGNNYYRLENGIRKIPYSADQKYFLSHSMPWAEFTGPHLIDRDFESLATGAADKFFGTRVAPYQQYRLYEFPNRTFGELKATNSAGVESEIPVSQMGYNQLHFGDNATRRVGWTSAPRYPGEQPEWGNIDRPLHYNRFGEGLYDATPKYSNMHLGNQTVVEGSDLTDALRTSAYSVYEPTPYGVQRTLYGPHSVQETRWLADDMAAPEETEIAKRAAQRIAGEKSAAYSTRRDYDLMYRGDEYNAALYEGRYPTEAGVISDSYKQDLQQEIEDAVQRMTDIGLEEHSITSDDIISEMKHNAAGTRINLVTRENSSPKFDNPNRTGTTSPNPENSSPDWTNRYAYPSTISIPLFNQRMRYSNILEPAHGRKIPIYGSVTDNVVKGVNNHWYINDPFFGKITSENNWFYFPSEIWKDIQHEAQHAAGQNMVDLSITHQPNEILYIDNTGNRLGYVENPYYPMNMIGRNLDLGTENWGKYIGGKIDEIDAELHMKIAEQQYNNPRQNITGWNSLNNQQKSSIINGLKDRFEMPADDIENIIKQILGLRRLQNL